MQETTTLSTNMTSVGKTKWRTCFSSISWSGLKLDVLKSALQKYLRRREHDKMLWCLSEIYLFQALAPGEKERAAAKGIISNLVNRLIIMMDEEMVFAEVKKYMQCMAWVKDFEEGGRADIALLVKICKTMLGARMIRLNSDIYTYWRRGVSVYKVVKKVPGVGHEEDLYSPVEVHQAADKVLSAEEKIEPGWAVPRDYLMGFIIALYNKHPSCYHWALEMFHCDVKGKRRFRRTDCVYAVWEHLFNEVADSPLLTKCLELKLEQFFVKGRNERHIWLSSAVSIVLHRDKLMLDDDWDMKVTRDELIALFKDRKCLKIDDYAIDMHCSAGRKMGKKKSDFALEGAKVIGEDTEYLVETWRNLYEDVKINPEKYGVPTKKGKKGKKGKKAKKKSAVPVEELEHVEISDDAEIKICMEKTCGGKVMCFECNGEIWKEGRKSMGFNRDYVCIDTCKPAFGLQQIGMRRITANFRIEKIDKKTSVWKDNWKLVKTDDKVVYCIMRKIGKGVSLGIMKAQKSPMMSNPEVLKELAKIAMFRGVFRATDFCLRNVLLEDDDSLTSIDEGDMGKRKSIFGAREKWMVRAMNKDEIIGQALREIMESREGKMDVIRHEMQRLKYDESMIAQIKANYDRLKDDLVGEGFTVLA